MRERKGDKKKTEWEGEGGETRGIAKTGEVCVEKRKASKPSMHISMKSMTRHGEQSSTPSTSCPVYRRSNTPSAHGDKTRLFGGPAWLVVAGTVPSYLRRNIRGG